MNTSNIFGFEETEKMGLRKGVVFYFNDWIDEKIIYIFHRAFYNFDDSNILILDNCTPSSYRQFIPVLS